MLFNRDAWHQGSGVQMSPLSDIHATSLSNHFWRETGRGRENKKKYCFLIFKNSLQNLIKAEQKLTFLPL